MDLNLGLFPTQNQNSYSNQYGNFMEPTAEKAKISKIWMLGIEGMSAGW